MIDASEFQFPTDLRVTTTDLKHCLFIGSCMADDYLKLFKDYKPNIEFDYIIFNNISDMPENTGRNPLEYDFQFVQIPLRFVISDSLISTRALNNAAFAEELFENSKTKLKLMLDSAMKYNRLHGILTFVSNFIVPQIPTYAGLDSQETAKDFSYVVKQLNAYLSELIKDFKNTYLVDQENTASSIGKRHFLDDAIVFSSHNGFWFPLWNNDELGRIETVPEITLTSTSQVYDFMRAIWNQMEHTYRVVQQIDQVKLVIFDLDDTMWRGQIAEHYGDDGNHPMYFGWPLGISEAVQHLRARGILTAICSKNNEETVRNRWDRAAPLSWVSMDDFAVVEINWNPKAANIANILAQTNLTAKSVVFVDDNPVERESVRAAFPGMRTLGSDPFNTRRILLCASETQVKTVTDESANREETIKRQKIREADRSVLSREDFLLGLNCQIKFIKLNGDTDDAFSRCHELLNKTNQFNTNGKRWTTAELTNFMTEGGEVICFYVEDKYTKYGLVGVILIDKNEFVQYVMSCRVLGLDVESNVVRHIANYIFNKSEFEYIYGYIAETELNIVSRDVYVKAGFSKHSEQKGAYVMKNGNFAYSAHINIESLLAI